MASPPTLYAGVNADKSQELAIVNTESVLVYGLILENT